MGRNTTPGVNQYAAEIRIQPNGTVPTGTGFGFLGAPTVITPLQVFDLQYDPEMVGETTDATDSVFVETFVPTEPGANFRQAVVIDNGLGTGTLRVSIVDEAGASADLLTFCIVSVRRFAPLA